MMPVAKQHEVMYLASPYSSPTKEVMLQRYEAAQAATAWLLMQRRWVFSPIVHCHELARCFTMPVDFHFWQDYNLAMLSKADTLTILAIDGWKESKGVLVEWATATAEGKETFLMTPTGVEANPYKLELTKGPF